MLIASSYLKIINRSFLNVQAPVFFKVPTCTPFTALLIIVFFPSRQSPGSLLFLWILQFSRRPSTPGRLEKYSMSWKKGISINTQNTLVRSGLCHLLGFHNSFPSFPAAFDFLPIAPCHCSFLLSCLYPFSLLTFHSLLLLKFSMFFSSHSPPLIVHLFFVYIFRANYLSWSHASLIQMLVLLLSVRLDE